MFTTQTQFPKQPWALTKQEALEFAKKQADTLRREAEFLEDRDADPERVAWIRGIANSWVAAYLNIHKVLIANGSESER